LNRSDCTGLAGIPVGKDAAPLRHAADDRRVVEVDDDGLWRCRRITQPQLVASPPRHGSDDGEPSDQRDIGLPWGLPERLLLCFMAATPLAILSEWIT
jgi:hypothetical protein